MGVILDRFDLELRYSITMRPPNYVIPPLHLVVSLAEISLCLVNWKKLVRHGSYSYRLPTRAR